MAGSLLVGVGEKLNLKQMNEQLWPSIPGNLGGDYVL